ASGGRQQPTGNVAPRGRIVQCRYPFAGIGWLGMRRLSGQGAAEHQIAPDAGDVWTWVGIDADSKLAISWWVGGRGGETAKVFMDDLASRLANRVQLTSDGHKAYLQAVEDAFGGDVDYAQLVKMYGQTPEGQRRYS